MDKELVEKVWPLEKAVALGVNDVVASERILELERRVFWLQKAIMDIALPMLTENMLLWNHEATYYVDAPNYRKHVPA